MTFVMDFMERIHPSDRVIRWMMRLLYTMAAVAVILVAARPFFMIGINIDHSLPGYVFLIQKGSIPHRGQIMAFRFQGYKPYFPAGAIFVKILAGIPGDTARTEKHGCIEYLVNKTIIGCVKPRTRDGKPLIQGSVGVIPSDHYAVRGTDPDSFDSRYAGVGWISGSQIIGRAYRLI